MIRREAHLSKDDVSYIQQNNKDAVILRFGGKRNEEEDNNLRKLIRKIRINLNKMITNNSSKSKADTSVIN